MSSDAQRNFTARSANGQLNMPRPSAQNRSSSGTPLPPTGQTAPNDDPGLDQPLHEPADALLFDPGQNAGAPEFEGEEFDAGMEHGLARRRGRGRRLAESLRAAEEGELTNEQFLFVMAIDAFKRANGVSFPAWSDVLEIIRVLGYRKTCKSELVLSSGEDWMEKHDSPSNVRPKGFERRLTSAAEQAPQPAQANPAKKRRAA